MFKRLPLDITGQLRAKCRSNKRGFSFVLHTNNRIIGIACNTPRASDNYFYIAATGKTKIISAADRKSYTRTAPRPANAAITMRALYASRHVDRALRAGYAFTPRADSMPANDFHPEFDYYLLFADNIVYTEKMWRKKNKC